MVLSEYCGTTYLHLRHYETNPHTMKLYPTKRGVCLNKSTCTSLMNQSEEIESHLKLAVSGNKNIGQCLSMGYGVFFTTTFNGKFLFDIRHYFRPNHEPRPIPTKRGIILTASQMLDFFSCRDDIAKLCPEMTNSAVCWCSRAHHNMITPYLDCGCMIKK